MGVYHRGGVALRESWGFFFGEERENGGVGEKNLIEVF